jgi:tetratricopeptide (TPR) repeat protein
MPDRFEHATLEERLQGAVEAQRSGDQSEVERLCRLILAEAPKNPTARVLLGIVSLRRGDPTSAIEVFQSVLDDDPNEFDALNWLSHALRRVKRLEEGVETARRACQLRPHDPEALLNLGAGLMETGRFEEAAEILSRTVELWPRSSPAHYHLGICTLSLGRTEQAETELRIAVNIGPKVARNHLGLGQALLANRRFQAAEEAAANALALDSGSAAAHVLTGQILSTESKLEEAEASFRRALECDPGSADAYANLGSCLQEQGELEASRSHLERAIELDPHQCVALYCLAQGTKFVDPADPLLGRMESVAAEPSLPAKNRLLMHYGIGKANQDLGRLERAMRSFDEANRIGYEIWRRPDRWNAQVFQANIDRTIEFAGAGFLERSLGAGFESDLPILIVGMIRSGTTLTEQVLASHPEVGGIGENPFWIDHVFDAVSREAGALDPARARQVATRYCEELESLAPGKRRVADKMPANYALLGLIHAHLPNARLIHVQRDPIDTCLSIWTTFIGNPPEFAFDRNDIVFAYRQYVKCMDHWRKVIPADRLLEIRYEELVSDPEPVIRRMLEFCGLSWSETCLKPEENARKVTTPSLWRVRQPIDRSSVERWRRYEPWLGELRQLAKS